MPTIALLIDAENASAKNIDQVVFDLQQHGQLNDCLIFGDWQNNTLSSWNDAILKHALKQYQQNAYTKAKNASDIALVIAAMELLYTKDIDEFAIMSLDSDFTPLVQKLRQMGKKVWGFVGINASLAFQQACDHCIILKHNLQKNNLQKKDHKPKPTQTQHQQAQNTQPPNANNPKNANNNPKNIEQTIITIINDSIAQGKSDKGWVSSSIIGTKLSEQGIKPKNLGYSSLQKLLNSLTTIKSKFCNQKSNYFYRYDNAVTQNTNIADNANNDRKTTLNNNIALIEKIKTAFCQQSKKGDFILVSNIAGVLGNTEYQLKSRTYGYATWTKLFNDLACFETKKQGTHPMIKLKQPTLKSQN